MKKLLHERLREADKGNHIITFGGNGHTIVLFPREAEALADEIERYYIPRPRFEDGEPVDTGMAAMTQTGHEGEVYRLEMPYMGDRLNVLVIYGDGEEDYANYEYVKRPSTKALDADGVEIKVGDTVWSMYFPNNKRIVDHITDDGQVWFEDGHWAWDIKVTHKEPDSLEKLRDEIANFDDLGYQYRPQLHKKWADRLSALIERVD